MKFAALIPTFNGSQLIGDTVRSLTLAMGRHKLIDALYVADDASADNTTTVVRSMWTTGQPLRILQGESNLGECANVNRAFRTLEQDGIDWVLLLHQDDLVCQGWIEESQKQIEISSPDVALVCCHCDYHFGAESIPPTKVMDRNHRVAESVTVLHPGNVESLRQLRHNWYWNISGTVVNVRLFNKIGGLHPLLTYAADVDLLCRTYLGGFAVLEVNSCFLIRRGHLQSQTSRAIQTGAEVLGWAFIMHRYMFYSSMFDRTIEYMQQIKRIAKYLAKSAIAWEWQAVVIDCRKVDIIVRSYIALIFNCSVCIPNEIKRLLDYPLRMV